jgi:hypothetical protein
MGAMHPSNFFDGCNSTQRPAEVGVPARTTVFTFVITILQNEVINCTYLRIVYIDAIRSYLPIVFHTFRSYLRIVYTDAIRSYLRIVYTNTIRSYLMLFAVHNLLINLL